MGGAPLPSDAEPVGAGPEVAAALGSVHMEAVCGPETLGCFLGTCRVLEQVAEAGSCLDGSWEGSPCGESWNASPKRARLGAMDLCPRDLCCQECHLSR